MDNDLIELHARLGVPPTYSKTTRLVCYSKPANLVSIGEDVFGRPQRLLAPAATAWFEMQTHAERDAVSLQVVSAYRSATYQAEVIQRALDKGEAIEQILTRVAAPGFSEHQSGCALDLTTPGFEPVEQEFELSKAFGWLSDHAQKHGFHLSFPRDNPFGVIYEPWHWCYRPG